MNKYFKKVGKTKCETEVEGLLLQNQKIVKKYILEKELAVLSS